MAEARMADSPLTGAQVAAWTGGRWLGAVPPALPGVGHDTRTLAAGALFVAVVGERFDGHAFLSEACARGAGAVMVHDPAAAAKLPVPVLQVGNTRQALCRLAAGFRRACATRIVGITGSAGKTTVKELLIGMLGARHKVAGTQGNWNNDIGLPLSLLNMAPGAAFGVFEVGTNAPGEIAGLAAILAPDVGVITAIGPAHLAGFGSVARIADEKADLLRALPAGGTGLWPADCLHAEQLAAACAGKRRTVALDAPADVTAHLESAYPVAIRIPQPGGAPVRLTVPLCGRFNAVNVLLAAAAARTEGVDWADIAAGAQAVRLPRYRWQETPVAGRTFINDAYNANPLSMQAGLEAFAGTAANGDRAERLWLVLGDMLELGPDERALHEAVGRQVAGQRWAGLVAVGARARWLAAAVRETPGACAYTACVDDAAAAAAELSRHAPPGACIYLKASRGMALERVIDAFRNLEESHG